MEIDRMKLRALKLPQPNRPPVKKESSSKSSPKSRSSKGSRTRSFSSGSATSMALIKPSVISGGLLLQ